jgi:2-hydroxycyclohexanecarboxyl-CoA dehydrogenase
VSESGAEASIADFSGKIALVTGGTVGVGLDIARRLLRGGAHVVINGRSAERGRAALATLREVGPAVTFAEGDSGDYEVTSRIVKEIVTEHGGIDMLVSAGAESGVGATPFTDMTGEDLAVAFTTRVFPRIFPLHAAMPTIRERRGSVVMLTTDAARFATPGESIVGAAGAAVIAATKTVAKEMARHGVRVNSVALTLTSGTAAWDRVFANPNFTKKLFSSVLDHFPLGRAPTAEEVAGVVVFLLSDAAGQVNGQTISVNGGLSFGGW